MSSENMIRSHLAFDAVAGVPVRSNPILHTSRLGRASGDQSRLICSIDLSWPRKIEPCKISPSSQTTRSYKAQHLEFYDLESPHLTTSTTTHRNHHHIEHIAPV